jgi:hypothetical protein
MTKQDKYISGALFLVGIIYWYLFYLHGASSMAFRDWVLEAVYINTVRTAVEETRVPWAWDVGFYHGVTLFLANPEVVLTPDVLLLPWLSNKWFFFLHHCILYTVSFFVLNKISRLLNFKLPAYLFLYLIFNFNGYITSHIAEGHYPWTGYYLIPLYLYCLKMAFDTPAITSKDLSVGCILGVLFLNGSGHIAVWLSIFTVFLYVFDLKSWPKLVTSLTTGFILGACRIIPSLAYFPRSQLDVMQTGYVDFITLLNAFTQLRGYSVDALTGLGWWEYSCYIGFTGFFSLVLGVTYYFRSSQANESANVKWAIAGIIMFLLSLGNTWGILSTLHLPFGSVERLSTRFIVLPFLLATLITAYGINQYLAKPSNRRYEPIFWALVTLISVDLFYQFLNWRLAIFEISAGGPQLIPTIGLVDTDNSTYKYVVSIAWVSSGIGLVIAWVKIRAQSIRNISY